MDDLRLLINIHFSRPIPGVEIDNLTQRVQWLLEDAIGNGDLDIEELEVTDFDFQVELHRS